MRSSAARVLELIAPHEGSQSTNVPAKDPDVFRIFVYGGSTVAGAPVAEWGFVSQLDFWLQEARPDKQVEVYNFGRPGRSSTFVRWMVDRTIGDNPDLLIVLTGNNEFLGDDGAGWFQTMVVRLATARVLLRVRAKVAALLPSEARDVMPADRVAQDREPTTRAGHYAVAGYFRRGMRP